VSDSLAIVKTSADVLPAPLLLWLLKFYQGERCFWEAALEALENPIAIWRLSSDEFEALHRRRAAAAEQAVAAFDLIASRYEERFGPVSQRMETELL
jgi:hypothetical protein